MPNGSDRGGIGIKPLSNGVEAVMGYSNGALFLQLNRVSAQRDQQRARHARRPVDGPDIAAVIHVVPADPARGRHRRPRQYWFRRAGISPAR